MKPWAHSMVSVALVAITIGTPQAQAVVSAHPVRAVCAMAGWAILGHVMESPWPWFARKLGR